MATILARGWITIVASSSLITFVTLITFVALVTLRTGRTVKPARVCIVSDTLGVHVRVVDTD